MIHARRDAIRATGTLRPSDIPATECLRDTVARVLPFWKDSIAPAIQRGRRVIVAAHGNSLRALIKYLDDISDDDIVGLNIPTATAAGLRTRRRPEAAASLLPGRCRGDRARHGGGRRTGQVPAGRLSAIRARRLAALARFGEHVRSALDARRRRSQADSRHRPAPPHRSRAAWRPSRVRPRKRRPLRSSSKANCAANSKRCSSNWRN